MCDVIHPAIPSSAHRQCLRTQPKNAESELQLRLHRLVKQEAEKQRARWEQQRSKGQDESSRQQTADSRQEAVRKENHRVWPAAIEAA